MKTDRVPSTLEFGVDLWDCSSFLFSESLAWPGCGAYSESSRGMYDRSDVSSIDGSTCLAPADLYPDEDDEDAYTADRPRIKPWTPMLVASPSVAMSAVSPSASPETTSLPNSRCYEETFLSLDVSHLHRIAGYEDVAYHNNNTAPLIRPPSDNDTDRNVNPRRSEFQLAEDELDKIGCITEEEAQEALLGAISKDCCYGESAAKEMEVYKITPSNALHYTLETFSENRSTSWDQEPYTGQKIDGPSNGPAPMPWDIHCNPTHMFHNEVRFMEVPHTATVTSCHSCSSVGWNRCHGCVGRGFKRCISCCGSGRLWKMDAYGHRHVDTCWHCHGTGRKRCSYCGGDGRVVCNTCQGYRNLKCYIKLRVEYYNNFSDHVIEHTEFPEHLIKEVTGECVLEQIQPRVTPISDFPEEELCIASQNFHQQHIIRSRNTRILMQRQRLKMVAISECCYTWVNFEGRFWVYGKEMAVYAPDYPQKHCCGCTIL